VWRLGWWQRGANVKAVGAWVLEGYPCPLGHDSVSAVTRSPTLDFLKGTLTQGHKFGYLLVDDFLANHPQVRIHFTPTYSSWVNQLKIWFAKIQRRVIARGIFPSVDDLP
jgi:hypothetical protein